MAFLDTLFRRAPPAPTDVKAVNVENTDVPLSAALALLQNTGDNPPIYGERVTHQNAMAVAAVYRCINIISGTIAALPLGVYIDDPTKGRIADPTHRLDSNFNNRPLKSVPMTAFAWKEHTSRDLLREGNSYSAIRYDGAARVIGLAMVSAGMGVGAAR